MKQNDTLSVSFIDCRIMTQREFLGFWLTKRSKSLLTYEPDAEHKEWRLTEIETGVKSFIWDFQNNKYIHIPNFVPNVDA